MGASIQRDLRSDDDAEPGAASSTTSTGWSANEPLDPEVEAEVQTIAAWFEALPAAWRTHLDHEARFGREAYTRT